MDKWRLWAVGMIGGLLGGSGVLLWGSDAWGGQTGGPGDAPPAATDKPVKELFAFCNMAGYLDGPRRQAMSGVRVHAVDAQGNAYNVALRSMCALRVARIDGMVETIAGDNRWCSALDLEEGPAAWLPNIGAYGGIGQGTASIAVRGLPLDGGDKGCLYARAGVNTGHPDWVYRIWKNEQKAGRWWFKHVMGGGAANPPTAVGQSAPALSVKLAPVLSTGQDGKLYVQSEGSLYRYDEDKGELTCLLALADYADKVDKKGGKSIGGAENIIMAADGSFYLGYYNRTYPVGHIYHVSSDRTKVEKIAEGAGARGRMDGPGLGTAWFGGPILHGYYPPDIVFAGAIDDSFVRRVQGGRVSTLCKDGQWREFATYQGTGERTEAQLKDDQACNWGRGWVRVGNDTLYQLYWVSLGSTAIYRIRPIDFGKPTVGPLVEGK